MAFDCGPCCTLSNDLIKEKNNKEFDNNGIIAAKGKVNKDIVKNFLNNKFFKLKAPKSLDRLDINFTEIYNLNVMDGLATVNYFIAETLKLGIQSLLGKVSKIIIVGGGRKNKDLLKKIKNKLNYKIILSDDLNINGDLIESYAFAYLAIRSIKGLPISFPTTTGIKKPASGGKIVG